MFIVTAKLPKQRRFLAGAVIALILLCAVLLLRRSPAPSGGDSLHAPTDEQRTAYLEALGWEVRPEPVESLRLTLPAELTEPYRSYNELQLRQGFDLTPFLGETLERYTFAVTNHPAHSGACLANLYLYAGDIVAGDIICTGADGFIATLEYPAPEESAPG